MSTQKKVLYDVRIGEGTGKAMDLRVLVREIVEARMPDLIPNKKNAP
jgi:hypothetical protein